MITGPAPIFVATQSPSGDVSAPTADEAALMDTVQSSAGVAQRAEACRRLLDSGTAHCIPVLAAALDDEGVAHAALHTLERLPQPEATAALRQALTSLTGPLKASVADALGWRKDPLAVPLLEPLLRDRDEALAAASALALGRIGDGAAEAALITAMGQTPIGVRPTVMEACLLCAEARLQAGQIPAAIALYERILTAGPPQAVKAAANRGLLVSDEPRRAERLARWITGSDSQDRRVALRFLPDLRDGSAVLPLLPQWKALPAVARISLLENHRLLGREAPALALMSAQEDDPAVRQTALRVMGEMNSPDLVPVLAEAAFNGPKPEQLVARNSLAAIAGPGINDAILKSIGQSSGTKRSGLEQIHRNRGNDAP
jgi:HEAT repeat protein